MALPFSPHTHSLSFLSLISYPLPSSHLTSLHPSRLVFAITSRRPMDVRMDPLTAAAPQLLHPTANLNFTATVATNANPPPGLLVQPRRLPATTPATAATAAATTAHLFNYLRDLKSRKTLFQQANSGEAPSSSSIGFVLVLAPTHSWGSTKTVDKRRRRRVSLGDGQESADEESDGRSREDPRCRSPPGSGISSACPSE